MRSRSEVGIRPVPLATSIMAAGFLPTSESWGKGEEPEHMNAGRSAGYGVVSFRRSLHLPRESASVGEELERGGVTGDSHHRAHNRVSVGDRTSRRPRRGRLRADFKQGLPLLTTAPGRHMSMIAKAVRVPRRRWWSPSRYPAGHGGGVFRPRVSLRGPNATTALGPFQPIALFPNGSESAGVSGRRPLGAVTDQ